MVLFRSSYQDDGSAPPGTPVDRNNQLQKGNWFEAQLILSLTIGTFSFLTFCYLRARSSLTFAPRTHLSYFSPHPVHLSSGFFSWIIPTLKTSEQTVLEIVGLDAVVLLYFFKLGFYYFLACALLAFTILVPINIHENGTTEGVPPDPAPTQSPTSAHSFKSQNLISLDDGIQWRKLFQNLSLYHFSHLFFTYLFTFMLHRFLNVTYLRFINLKPIFSLAHHSSVPARTVMIENLPLHLRNKDALREYVSDLLRFDAENVTVVRDVSGLATLLTRRTVALKKLERAWTKWLGNPVRLSTVPSYSPQNELQQIMSPYHPETEDATRPQSPAHLRIPESAVDNTVARTQTTDGSDLGLISKSQVRLTSTRRRPTYRPSWCSLKKVDLIDHLTTQFQEADRLVRLRRQGKFRCTSIGFVTLKRFVDAQIFCQVVHWPNPQQARVSLAPEPRDIYWPNLEISPMSLKFRKGFVLLCLSLLYGFWIIPYSFLAKLMSYDTLTSILKPELIKWIEKSPTFKALLQNSLPTLAVNIFNGLLPFLLDWLSILQGFKSKSLIEYSLMKKYHLLLLITLLLIFVAVSTVSLLLELRNNPGELIDKIATSLPNARYFFVSYLMLQSLAIVPLQLLQLPNLFTRILYRLTGGTRTPRTQSEMKNMHLEVLSLGIIYPQALLAFTICTTYSVIAPVILIFGTIYFGMAYLVYKYKVLNVYYRPFESRGQAWPIACTRIGWGMVIFQVFMLGLLSLRQAFLFSTLVFPLVFYTIYRTRKMATMYKDYSTFISLSQIREAERNNFEEDQRQVEDVDKKTSEDRTTLPFLNKSRKSSVTPSQTNLNVKRYSETDESLYISAKDRYTDNCEPPMSNVVSGVLDTGPNQYAHPALFGRLPVPQLPVLRDENSQFGQFENETDNEGGRGSEINRQYESTSQSIAGTSNVQENSNKGKHKQTLIQIEDEES